MTLVSEPVSPSPPAAPSVGRDRVVLTDVSWETYRRLRDECRPLHTKMTYDRGTLEIMAPLPDHAFVTRFIDQLITAFSEGRDVPLTGYRDTTWRKEVMDRGLEADESYYIQNVDLAEQRGADIDINRDPPPDLALESDITHSTVDKESVYAALGVPELWRWDNGRLHIRLLAADGRYADASRSLALPELLPETIERFVTLRYQQGETTARRAFRDWVRETFSAPRGE